MRAASGKSANGASDADLFRQSEIAADYVEGLLDILDYDGDIDELVSAGRPMVEVVGGRLQPLVGQRGATLEALQELTRLAIFRQTGSPSRLLLDVGGYRANRRKELAAVAKNAVEKVKEHGEAGAAGADVGVRAQVRARRGQRDRRRGERVRGRRAEPPDRRPPGCLTVDDDLAARRAATPARAVRRPGRSSCRCRRRRCRPSWPAADAVR